MSEELNISDYIAIGALLASLLSLLVSVKSYHVSKGTMAIAEQDHQDKYKEIIGYLIEGFKWVDGDKSYVAFAISYTNNASYPNSFKDIFLEIEYYGEGRVFNKVKLSPSTAVLPVNMRGSWEDLGMPINISPKETKSGWIAFQLPGAGRAKISVDTYRVIATSVSGKTTVLESYILKTVVNNER
ncbi:hypothetical protein [Pseudomonas fulva]|uniref:hypothetical protein n=1 Tax=Pseudomonas fulva TaxID=47880 RepID=UPI0012F507B2|nr:hypothetical protein [Pseudomonas fulva]